jgi:hypothetical protein
VSWRRGVRVGGEEFELEERSVSWQLASSRGGQLKQKEAFFGRFK